MAKTSSFKNMVICLLVCCLAGSALLAGVYVLTYQKIEEARVAKINAAIGQVLPEFDNLPGKEAFTTHVDGQTIKIYPALRAGVPTGYAVEATTTKGFGGPVTVMVGFTPQGEIYKTAVISHSETPGLGDKMDPKKSPFTLQFEGKNPQTFRLAVKKDGGEVDAITAATISSRAFCEVMAIAYKAYLSTQD